MSSNLSAETANNGSTANDLINQLIKVSQQTPSPDNNNDKPNPERPSGCGLVNHGKKIIINLLILIPIYIMLFVAAVFSSIISAKLAGLDDIGSAYGWSIWASVALWISVIFIFLPALIFISTIVGLSAYIFVTFLALVIILNLIIIGFYTYVIVKVLGSSDSDTSSAFWYSSILITFLSISSLGMLLYSIWSIKDYRRCGGARGDVKYTLEDSSKVAEYVAPLAAPIAGPEVLAVPGVLKGASNLL